jgi:hypothetical protein
MPSMKTIARPIAGLLLAVCVTAAGAVTPVHKCVVEGASVSYQRDPCPSGQPRQAPTLEQLNRQQAEAKKKQREAATAAAAAAATTGSAANGGRARDPLASPTPAPLKSAGGFKCDSRKHCSQMRSCAEAKYFLANCPGVKLDGDRNGIPCEQQWCGR